MNQFADLFLPRIPLSNQSFTYAFVPRDFLRGLFGACGLDLPTRFTTPGLGLPNQNDTIPSNINISTISYFGEFSSAPLTFLVPNPRTKVSSPDNNQAINHYSIIDPYPPPAGNQGWTTVETVLVRLSTVAAPSGRFPVHFNLTVSKNPFGIAEMGYDAAVCVQKYEPWIIGAYNTSIAPPSALGIVERGGSSTWSLPSVHIQGAPVEGTRHLNATGKYTAFVVAHTNSILQLKRASQVSSAFFYPSTSIVGPTVPSCTTSLLTSTSSTDQFFHRRR